MRLKNFTLSFLLIFSFGFANGQCEIVNNSYEEWFMTDFVLPDGGSGEASGEVILPVGNTPLIRLLFLSFAAAFDPSYALLLENEAQELSGVTQSTDASEGNFAVKLQGGYGIETSDLYTVSGCTELPDQFNIDVKHVGTSGDTLTIFVIFDEGLNSFPEDEDDLATFPAYASTQLALDATTEYETFSLPVIQNFEAPIDTFYYLIIAETFEDGYFLIDNVNFEDENSGCTVEATTVTMTNSEDMTCICHGLDVDLGLVYVEDPAYQYNELIINADGLIESIDDFIKGSHDEFCSESNDLSVVVIAYEDGIEGLFEGQNIADLSGCYELSNAITLETYSYPEFEFNIFIDDEQQGEDITICLLDEIIEVFSFSTDIDVDNLSVFLINDNAEQVEIRIDGVDETTTLPDVEPGEYFLVAVAYDGVFNLEVGQSAEDISFEGCFSIPEESYYIVVLGPDDNCVTDVEDIYTGNLAIRPNYSSGIFEIDNPNNESYELTVRDISGKVVSVTNNNSKGKMIDLSNFPNGLYIASFQIEGFVHQEKIVKF